MSEPVILIGAFLETIELCNRCGKTIVGIIDNSLSGSFHGHPILGDDSSAAAIREKFNEALAVITPDSPAVRKKLATLYRESGYRFAALISPRAVVAPSASIGEGVIIQDGVNVSSEVMVGSFVRLNTYANLMHDCRIGDYSAVAPNAVLLGHVTVGDECYIGANATILPGVNIGAHSMVGASAVVTKNVRSGTTLVGNPAREKS